MMIPFLFTMGLCALVHTAVAQETQMEDVIPLEQNVQVTHLSNGVKTYIQHHSNPSDCASFRVVLRKPYYQEVQYSLDVKLESSEKVEEFFAYCKEKILNPAMTSKPSFDQCNFSSSDIPSCGMDTLDELAVIAVGDFQLGEMGDLIEKHFGGIVLNEEVFHECATGIQIGSDAKISKVGLSLSYPNARKSIVTYRDLKQAWKNLVLQELFQQRMERCSKGFDETWVHPHPRFFYPVNGYTYASEESSENLLSFLLWQVEAVRSDGFFEDEFYLTKRKMLNQLQYLAFNATQPDDAFLASYYADQFLLGDRCLSCQSFLDHSVNLLQEIQSEDVMALLPSFFLNENRQIKVAYPTTIQSEVLTEESVEKLIDRVATLAAFYRESEIDEEDDLWSIESTRQPDFSKGSINLMKMEEDPGFCFADTTSVPLSLQMINNGESFYQLPLSNEEMRLIKTIITTMAEKNIVQLALEKHSLEKKGKKITQVHPLRFMGFILSTPTLRSHLKTIKKSSFKWDAFIDGFAKRMKEELSKGNVYPHVPGFAQLLGTTPEHVNRYVQKKDFVGLVKSLL